MADTTSEPDAIVAQPVSAPLTRAAIFLVVTIDPGADNSGAIRSFCADFSGLVRAVEFRDLRFAYPPLSRSGSGATTRALNAWVYITPNGAVDAMVMNGRVQT